MVRNSEEQIKKLQEQVAQLAADNDKLVARNMELSQQLCMWYELRQRVNWLKEEMLNSSRIMAAADSTDDGELFAEIEAKLEQDMDLLTADFDGHSLAEMLGVSQARLTRLFRNTPYRSADDYLDFLRTIRGIQLLRDHPEYGIVGVSEMAGFNSVRTFQRRVSEAVGMTPVEFRMMTEKVADVTGGKGR